MTRRRKAAHRSPTDPTRRATRDSVLPPSPILPESHSKHYPRSRTSTESLATRSKKSAPESRLPESRLSPESRLPESRSTEEELRARKIINRLAGRQAPEEKAADQRRQVEEAKATVLHARSVAADQYAGKRGIRGRQRKMAEIVAQDPGITDTALRRAAGYAGGARVPESVRELGDVIAGRADATSELPESLRAAVASAQEVLAYHTRILRSATPARFLRKHTKIVGEHNGQPVVEESVGLDMDAVREAPMGAVKIGWTEQAGLAVAINDGRDSAAALMAHHARMEDDRNPERESARAAVLAVLTSSPEAAEQLDRLAATVEVERRARR